MEFQVLTEVQGKRIEHLEKPLYTLTLIKQVSRNPSPLQEIWVNAIPNLTLGMEIVANNSLRLYQVLNFGNLLTKSSLMT